MKRDHRELDHRACGMKQQDHKEDQKEFPVNPIN